MKQLTQHYGPIANTRSAFTLVELIAVMLIVTVIGIVAGASLGGLDDRRSRMAIAEIASELTHARERAMATGTRTWVSFDVAADSYAHLVEDPANPGLANATVPVDGPVSYAATMHVNRFTGVDVIWVDFDSTTSIGFDEQGRPYSANEVELAARGRVEVSLGHAVTVERVTGHIMRGSP